jgi:hypothetical protein
MPERFSSASVQLVDLNAPVLQQPHQQTRVDVAGPGDHDQSGQRREAHRGVEADAVAHRRQRRPRAEVARHDA